jgi:hypothetical protein
MIIVKILLILITTGLIVGLTGILVSFCIDSLTNIDATDAMQVFITMALISLILFAMFGIAALAAAAFGIWTNM